MASAVASTTDGIDQSLLEIQQSIEQAEGMLNQLESKGQGDSPTGEKIRKLLDQMRLQRKTLLESLGRVNALGNKMTFLQEIEDRQERGEGVKFETAMPKIPFRPPQPPSEEEPAESSRPIEREARSLSPLLDKSPDILSMMGHILGKTSEPGKSPKWKLEQLEQLESQLSGLKSTIDEAKTAATKELEDHNSVNTLPLKNNFAFRELEHEVSTMKVLHTTQHDRLKDVVSILNNHADRLATIEESISEMRQDMKRTTMNSMSERLLEKLLETHQSRPHFVLELFELGLCLDTDALRARAITAIKASVMREKMSGMNQSPQKTPDAGVSLLNTRIDRVEMPMIENAGPNYVANDSPKSQKSNATNTNQSSQEEEFVSISAAETEPNMPGSGEKPNVSESDNVTDAERTRDSDVQDSDVHSDNNEARILAQEDRAKEDMVSQLLGAATAGIDINKLNDDVQKMVTQLLPILATKYRDKNLTQDVIAEAKEVITDFIISECQGADQSFFNDGQNRVYLMDSMEQCLQAYKNLSVHDQSVNLLADIGTSIYRSILNAKLIDAKEKSPRS